MEWFLTILSGAILLVVGAGAKHYFDARQPFKKGRRVVTKSPQEWQEEANR